MNTFELDEDLETIKAFHTFLTDILEKGYNNNILIIKSIVKNINNYIKTMITSENDSQNDSQNNSDNNESQNNSDDNQSDDDENEELIKLKEKIQLKINDFLSSPINLSKYYLYQKDKTYITKMNQYINKSFIY